MNIITPNKLLLMFLELKSLAPDFNCWTEEKLSDNPPRFYRLRQLTALFKAYGIPFDPNLFMLGEFIDPDNQRYHTILMKLSKGRSRGKKSRKPEDTWALSKCFETLLDYRMRLDEVLSFSSGVLTAPPSISHVLKTIGKLNQVINKNITPIEDILAEFISPEGLTFTIEQMVRDYEYPDVDLFDIDMDWQ